MLLKNLIVLLIILSPFYPQDHRLIGDYMQIVLPVTGLGLSIDDGTYNNILYAYGSTLALTYVIKLSLNSTRPHGGGLSFPSGHTASAFVGAYYIQKKVGGWYGALGYSVAAYTGWSRIEAGKHYYSDIIAGAALAYLTCWFFDSSKVKVSPIIQLDGQYALNISLGM